MHGGVLKLFYLLYLAVIIKKHKYGHGADNYIPQNTVSVGQLPKEYESQQRGENDLGIIVDRNLPGGCVAVSCGDGKLAAGGRKACQQQVSCLRRCHGVKVKKQRRERHKAGEGGEKEYNKRPLFASLPKKTHGRISGSGAKAPHKPHHRRHQLHIGECGLDNKKAARKGAGHRKNLRRRTFFPQKEVGENDREKRRHFIEHGGIGEHQMVHCIKIA